MTTIEEYLTKWKGIEGVKPQNEPEFINLFIEYINSIDDCRDIEFDGEGAYFGRQVQIRKYQVYKMKYDFGFEIAYDFAHKIAVYTDRHQGYWNPEYINLKVGDPRFREVREALMTCLYKAFGLPQPKTDNI